MNKEELKKCVLLFKNDLQELANIQAKVRDMREYFYQVSMETNDNGDIYLNADKVLIELGSLLASLITYTNEYEKETNDESNE